MQENMTNTRSRIATAKGKSARLCRGHRLVVPVFAGGAAAVPLYDTYRNADALTDDQFSLVAVAYFAPLVLGSLSNHHGCRPVSIAALPLAIAGCLTVLVVHSFLPLLIGGALPGTCRRAGLQCNRRLRHGHRAAPVGWPQP